MTKKRAEIPVKPPDDAFWQRYSPHHELPLSFVGSIFAHSAVIGILIVSGLGIWWSRAEANRPVSSDVVMMSGDGDGLGGFGGMPGMLGSAGSKSELAPQTALKLNTSEKTESAANTTALLQDVPKQEFAIPDAPMTQMPLDKDVAAELANITKDAEKAVQVAKQTNANPPKSGGNIRNTGTGVGNGNKDGSGGGGIPGGQSGPSGSPRKLSKREIFAMRWKFNLAGSGRQHADKLAEAGLIVVVPEPLGRFFVRIEDLKRRPVALTRMDLPNFKDAVQWRNDRPEDVGSRTALAQELRLPYVPAFVVLLLPQDRETQMADLEAEFAERNGRDLKMVRATLFDFELQNGKYQPVVRAQE